MGSARCRARTGLSVSWFSVKRRTSLLHFTLNQDSLRVVKQQGWRDFSSTICGGQGPQHAAYGNSRVHHHEDRGWKTRSAFDRYNIVDQSDLADAARLMEERHAQLLKEQAEHEQELAKATETSRIGIVWA
jgi:hypothetical protein